MPKLSEQKLIEGCLNNNRKCQKALYDEYKSDMYTLAYRITNNFDEANEVIQDGFIQVFESLKSFKGNSKLSTWIHIIVTRTAIKKINKRIQFVDLNDADGNVEFEWGSRIDGQILEQAILSLPDGYRTVFTLYEIEGYKHKEIADILNISCSTSKTQLRKAKILLQRKLKNYRL